LNRYHLKVSGFVQGVGFRYFASYKARTLDLTGWVENCYDGSVELEVQGKEENISAFIQMLREGSKYAEVEDIWVKKVDEIEEERTFRITD